MENVIVNVPDFRETYTLIDLSFGHYGKDKKVTWEKCREYFHLRFDRIPEKSNDFFFYLKDRNTLTQAPDIISEVENILNLEIKTSFRKTDFLCVMNILPSPFWKEDRMRMQFFTILLRASKFYDGKDYKSALKEYEFSKNTLSAVELFMSGSTKSKSSFEETIANNMGYGWCVHFNDLGTKKYPNLENPSQMLSRPTVTEDVRKEELKKIAYEINKITNKSDVDCWDMAVRYHQEINPLIFVNSSWNNLFHAKKAIEQFCI
jgi:hypothetical protein